MITQMGDSYLVARVQIYPLHIVKEYDNAPKKKKKNNPRRWYKEVKIKKQTKGLSNPLGNVCEHLA
jgi:hypothetical protein